MLCSGVRVLSNTRYITYGVLAIMAILWHRVRFWPYVLYFPIIGVLYCVHGHIIECSAVLCMLAMRLSRCLYVAL
jgi:hypothetical protein